MATDAGRKIPQQSSVVSSINSPKEAVEVVLGFKSALKTLSSEHGFQSLAELVDRIPRLEAEIREKEKSLRLAHEAGDREKTTHDNVLNKNLQLYKDDVARSQKQTDSLEQQKSEPITKLSQKDEAIAKLQRTETDTRLKLSDAEDTCKGLMNKLKTKDGEIAQSQQKNQDDHVKIGSLAAELRKAQAEVAATKASLRKSEERGIQMDKALKAVQSQQEEVASYAARLVDINSDELAHDFGNIWASVTVLVRKFVGEDLSNSTLKRPWDKLNGAARYVMEQLLPQSNSGVAKELRVVKVLAILADTIHKHLLQPTYQPPDEGFALSQALYHLASIDPKRERMLRGMLLAALESQREDAEDQLIDCIVEDVMRAQGVEEVIRPELFAGFEEELKDILSDVQDIWYRVQRSTQVFQSSFTGTQGAEFELQAVEPRQDDAVLARALEDDNSVNQVVMLFPMIVRLGEQTVPITSGTIIRKDRVAALIKEERRSSRPVDQGPSRPRQKQRTSSWSTSGRNGQAKEIFLHRTAVPNGPSNA